MFAYATPAIIASVYTPRRFPQAQGADAMLNRDRHLYMNAIVLVALRRPLTFVVMTILVILFGAMAVL
ncbi:hypothetical protein [Paraburkholderia sp.]|uniref:hypothetical protein n=1 Tax=Paraburkholderia sp. TaxID=1926495 RepID=UPI002F3F0605